MREGITTRKRYQQSEKGRAAAKRYYEKRKLRLKAVKTVQATTENKVETVKEKVDRRK